VIQRATINEPPTGFQGEEMKTKVPDSNLKSIRREVGAVLSHPARQSSEDFSIAYTGTRPVEG
jgi:hypothetical protein